MGGTLDHARARVRLPALLDVGVERAGLSFGRPLDPCYVYGYAYVCVYVYMRMRVRTRMRVAPKIMGVYSSTKNLHILIRTYTYAHTTDIPKGVLVGGARGRDAAVVVVVVPMVPLPRAC